MFIDRGGDDTWGKDGHINLGHTLRSPALTHSQYLQDLIRVSRCNKVPTWPTETKGFTTRSMQPLVMSAASSSSISSSFSSIFHLPFLLHYNSVALLLCHIALPFTLTFHAPISLSPTLSINICLWVCLFPRFPLTSEESSLVDVHTHSRLEVMQLQELTDQGFHCHTRLIEDIRPESTALTVHSVNGKLMYLLNN